MITITKKEEVVLSQIKIFISEYPEGIPINFLKKELDFREYDLIQILNSLSEKELLEYNNDKIKVKDNELEINTVNSKKDLKELELGLKEKESLKLIKSLVDEHNLVSRYILEGSLLYGDLKLSDFRMYHIILSLENKGVLKSIKKDDGDYYLLVQ